MARRDLWRPALCDVTKGTNAFFKVQQSIFMVMNSELALDFLQIGLRFSETKQNMGLIILPPLN